jgi:O-antigen ligase
MLIISALAPFVFFASAFFGGMIQPIPLGIFLLINGLCILICGISSTLPKSYYLWAGTLFFLALLSSYFHLTPAGLPPAATQLGVSLESSFLLGAALLVLGWILGNPQGERKRLWIFRTYGWLVATTGILALIFQTQRWSFPFTVPTAYGIFPNPNHMSNWLAIAGILLAGTVYADIRKRQFLLAGFSFLGIAAILTCLAANSSRGGLGIFFLGLIAWAVAQTLAGPNKKVGIFLLAGAALAATTLLYQGAKPLERMKKSGTNLPEIQTKAGPEEDSSDPTLDFRLLLQRDALDLSAAHAWLGTGPGNFRYFFPSYRERTAATQSQAIHPESDWVWFLCEFGWPAMLVLLAGIFFLLRQAGPGRNKEGWITRSAGGAALLAFGLHGLADVPGHRIGTVWPILMVAGLICARKKEGENRAPASWEIWLVRGLGLALALGALLWTWGVATGGNWPATVAAAQSKAAVGAEWKAGSVEKALQAAERGRDLAPYDSVLRFLYGKALLFFDDTERETAAEFEIQAKLEPCIFIVPLDQATAWLEILPDRPELALPAYREALARSRFKLADNRGPEHVVEHMMRMSQRAPRLESQILPLIQDRPELVSLYLTRLPPEKFKPALAGILAANPDLQGWPPKSIGNLLVAWARRGQADTLLPLLETKPSWQEEGWPILAQLWAKAGRNKEALQLASRQLPPPTLPDDPCPPNQAESRWYRSPRDYGAAYVLAETRRKKGDLVGARVVLEKITERPEAPAYFWWLRSRVETEEGRDAAAWESLRKYLQRAVPQFPNV